MNTRLWTSLGVAGMLAGAAPGQVTIDIRASQSRGVAPLAVFFDASNSTGLAGNDYLQAHFSWNFGDSAAGAWSTTGLTRNTASGFIAAHVFETPGTYTVTVTVLDIDRISADGQVSITVDDPDEVYAASNTRCVSRNGVFSGAPPDAGALVYASVASVNRPAFGPGGSGHANGYRMSRMQGSVVFSNLSGRVIGMPDRRHQGKRVSCVVLKFAADVSAYVQLQPR